MSGGRSSVVVADIRRVLLGAAAGVTGVIALYFKLVKSQSPVNKRSLVSASLYHYFATKIHFKQSRWFLLINVGQDGDVQSIK